MRVLRPLVLSLLLVLGGGITALSAQNREVSGKVLDANQQPLVGVAVLVDGTTKGVTTSENGTFKIQVPSGEAVLQVTCLGYLPQKVTVPSSRNSITIYLQEDAIMLDATVVIGYGTQKNQPDRRRCDRREQGARKPRHPFAGQHVAGFRSGSQHHHLLG